MTRMLIVGPPGSGKGTQAACISEDLGIVAISAGDLLRAYVRGETPLGIEAKKYMDRGDFVPDSLTNRMICDRLNEADVENGFLLDGYPRTTAQVTYLDEILSAKRQRLDVALELTVDRKELIGRLSGRARATGRSDDREDVVGHRLDLYHEQTEAVLAVYFERGILTRIDGIGTIGAVTDRIFNALSIHVDITHRRPSTEHSAASVSAPLKGI